MKQLYLCRHGETEWSLSNRHTGKTDIPLTQKGIFQAQLLRKRLQAVQFDAIFTSPLCRAQKTCGNINAIVDPNLVEWDYGDYEGITSEQIHQKNPHWNLFADGALNGESAEDVGKRADIFLERIKSYEGIVAVFSHGHFLRVLTARYLNLAPSLGKMFTLSVAALSILGFEHENLAVLLWNDHHHLNSK